MWRRGDRNYYLQMVGLVKRPDPQNLEEQFHPVIEFMPITSTKLGGKPSVGSLDRVRSTRLFHHAAPGGTLVTDGAQLYPTLAEGHGRDGGGVDEDGGERGEEERERDGDGDGGRRPE